MIPNVRFINAPSEPATEWWSRSTRALPRIDSFRLSDVDPTILDDTRPFAVLMVARPLAAFAAFVLAALNGWWVAAVPLTWLIYGSALTCVHHLIHSSVGLAPRSRQFWLRSIGLLVAESGHALQVTHLAHHRTGAEVPDPEGYIENVTWARIPLAALAFRYRLAWWGLRHGPPARRRRIRVEMAVHAGLHLASLAMLPLTIVPWAYLSLIHLASFAFAVLAGKGPQTNWGRPIRTPLVRVHTVLGRVFFFSHDLHLEHHMYPKVPLPRLRRLEPQLSRTLASADVLDVRMPL